MKTSTSAVALGSVLLLSSSSLVCQAQLLWTVGLDDNAWPTTGTGGGEFTNFLQENGAINPLPGRATGSDNDYYFAGDYSNAIESVVALYGEYGTMGVVDVNEEAAERAFAGGDNDLRYHFNLPDGMQPTDLLTVSFDALNLDTGGHSDPRYGIEVYFNGVLVQPEILIRPPQIGKTYQTPQFSLGSVNGQVGAGFDNIVSLKGISYSAADGGAWMGIDYVKLEVASEPIAPPVFPWSVGADDNDWPVGDGGGVNATFVQENGVINPLPGSPASPEINTQADNDYYFGGSYTKTIPGVVAAYGDYTPVGTVSTAEEAAERAFAGGDNDLRYHFNLPNELKPTDPIAVTFDVNNLDDSAPAATRRYGVEVYFNGVKVQPEIVVGPSQIGKTITTPAFTLASVGAEVGAGFDNVVSLRGVNHSADGGGNWMGIDYVTLDRATAVVPPPSLPLAVGRNDNDWPPGDGGGANASFVQENGVVNALPGNPASPEIAQLADNDYYFAGSYTTVIPSVTAMYGAYSPVGPVAAHEEAAERAFAGADNDLRYHFNLPASLKPEDTLSVKFDVSNLDDSAAEATRRYGVEVYFNGVLVNPQVVVRPPQIGIDITTAPFTLASVNAQVGPGYDNVLTLKGINYSTDGGGNWMGIDYVQINPVIKATFPWQVGIDDNEWPAGNGGGRNASFMQENGTINPLPGSPANAEVDQQSDNDYYFAGDYATAIESVVAMYGEYTPVGLVLANEESAERAFAAADNDLRYHFNLPNSIQPNDLLTVTFDPMNLHTEGQSDPRYGIQVYFNGVLVQEEIIIRPPDLNVPITVAPFTAASVNAQVGPGFDNIVSLKGVNYNGDGGGNWMGIDHVMLSPINNSPFPIAVGLDDDAWPQGGTGGGPNANFVQEAGGITALPGRWTNPARDGRADNDYYFAGDYSTAIESVVAAYGDYTPRGLVPVNEEAAERAFAAADNDLRYHFNLPDSLQPTDLLRVKFDANNLDGSGGDPRYGIEVYFNGVLVQEQIVIRQGDLGTDYQTADFSLASVNAQVGRGYDNVVSLKGINYNGEGGGNWMGIDYVTIETPPATPLQFLPPTLANGGIGLDWVGVGVLESAPTVLGPWTPVTPAANPPFTTPVIAGQNRFFRLVKQP